jgi:hypothetical protein
MIGSQSKNPAGYSPPMQAAELALGQNDGKLLTEAVADHNRAIGLTAPHDSRLADLCHQRHRTLMRMGKHDGALADMQTCLQMQPRDPA